ncbi:EAL domain-containing protein [Desulfovibrio inopinatus]|uniref:EAL domain-containing protein n=1 Tax=Desulfovibrio inopinatus TaxID=102109 RepID=UPI0012EBABDC|nr:EAL domain-containing protein [Desulfovibrio inopinatus]
MKTTPVPADTLLVQAFDTCPWPIFICGKGYSILHVNDTAQNLARVLNKAEEELLPEHHAINIENCLAGEACSSPLEVRIGDHILSWTYRALPEPGSVALFGIDITARKKTEARLILQATHDIHTGLPNRTLFLDRLEYAIKHAAERQTYRFAVLYLDIDQFKLINDTLGHGVGDGILSEVSDRLKSCVGPEDTIARIGGDEFGILLDGIRDLIEPIHVADSIHEELSVPVVRQGQDIFLSASIGIVLNSKFHETPDNILRDADMAMYRAKTDGKSRFAMYDESMQKRALELLTLGSDLRRALERNEFFLHYQPIISLRTHKLAGLEALIRWQHPTQGLISPGRFIPMAEESGLIIDIGNWVLQTACDQVGAWNTTLAEPIDISVNLSTKQFNQPDLVGHVNSVLNSSGLAAKRLKLEVTESIIMENATSSAQTLLELKDIGIKLSVDDFGTGYSSLAYLRQFPLDTLKIDRSFVNKMAWSGAESEIVRAIVQLAHGLNLDVVAEGAETREQVTLLNALQCEYVQGFYFAKPAPAEEIAELLQEDKIWI